MTGRAPSAIALVFALCIAVGCGGSGSAKVAPDTPAQLAADTALAKHAVLQLHDLPDGYQQLPNSTSADDRTAERTLLACVGLSDVSGQPGRVLVRGRVFVQRLSSANVREVASGVVVERSAAALKARFSALTPDRATPCLKTFLNTEFTHDPKLTKLSPRGLTVRSISLGGVGDQRAAFEARVTFSTAGQRFPAIFDFCYARRGRAVAELSFVGLNTVFPATQSGALLEKVVNRLQGAS